MTSAPKKTVIVHIITCLDIGGAERFLCRLVGQMDSARFKSVVVNLSDPGPLEKDLKDKGIQVISLGFHRNQPLTYLKILSLVSQLRRIKPHIIQTWLYHGDLAGTLVAPFVGAQVLFWNIRCSEMDFKKYFFTTRWVVNALIRLSGHPNGIIHNSMGGRSFHEAMGYQPRQWIHLGNGLDLNQFRSLPQDREHLRKEWGVSSRQRVIGMVGRFDPMKDHDNLAKAIAICLKKHPNIHFILAGRGVTRDKPPFVNLPSEALTFLGERKDIPEIMNALDIFTLSSAFGEGFPNVIAEAMACGTPCVSTDVGDAAFIMGDTGQVVPVKNPEALAKAWSSLIQKSREELQELGLNAQHRIKENFSLEEITKAYEKLYEETLNHVRNSRVDRLKTSIGPKTT